MSIKELLSSKYISSDLIKVPHGILLKGEEKGFLEFFEKEGVQAEQVHENNVYFIREKCKGKKIALVDGIISDYNALLLVRTADCLPIFIYNPSLKRIALLHAGWKGTLNKILSKTLNEYFYQVLTDTYIWIGPGIEKKCYQIDFKTIEEFRKAFPKDLPFYDKKEGKYYLDLKLLSLYQAKEMGVLKDNIEVSSICTFCDTNNFYSYRRGDKEERNFSFILLKPKI